MTNEQWAMNNALYWGSLMRPRHPPQPRAAAPFQGGLVLIPLRRREGVKELAVAALYERRFFSFQWLGRRS